MASRADELTLEDPAMTEAWLRSFAALSRNKKLQDSDDEKEVTDLFLAKAGVNAVRVVSVMAHPKALEEMYFEEIKTLILEKVQPKKKWSSRKGQDSWRCAKTRTSLHRALRRKLETQSVSMNFIS